ncbi:hypothetical protein ABZ622_28540 [Streptomyces sp. NPDC007164]|uniref:hypothetical protein n=1 Tax=Streptomyces sp. NPDC007164 TaxID=3156918 RepID=UPI0033EA5B44
MRPREEERSEDVPRLCTRLSVRNGQARAYCYGAQGDGSAWLVAERGTVPRRCCETGEGEDELLTPGEPLPFERACRAELGPSPEWDAAQESGKDEAQWRTAAFDLAPEPAKALGVSPLAIGPDTCAHGVGVLATTPHGAAHGVPTGAYRVRGRAGEPDPAAPDHGDPLDVSCTWTPARMSCCHANCRSFQRCTSCCNEPPPFLS